MTYCHISSQYDKHSRQLSDEQLMDEASDLYMDDIRADYGPRLQELAAALADHISEDDLNGCLAVYRMENPNRPRPTTPKVDPKHRLVVSNLFRFRITQLAGRVASAVNSEDISAAALWAQEFIELRDAHKDLFGQLESEGLQALYDNTLAAELQLLQQKVAS